MTSKGNEGTLGREKIPHWFKRGSETFFYERKSKDDNIYKFDQLNVGIGSLDALVEIYLEDISKRYDRYLVKI